VSLHEEREDHDRQEDQGGHGEKVTLKLDAQFGDACNVGRDYPEIIKSAEADVFPLDEGDDPEQATARARGRISFADFTLQSVVGTPDRIRTHIQALIDAGIDYVIVYLPRVAYDHAPMERFAEEVIAHFVWRDVITGDKLAITLQFESRGADPPLDPDSERTMTELLRQVIARIELLPSEQQDAIAEKMQRELEELEWDALVAKPSSQRYLAHLAAEAREEDAAGLTEESTDRW
jgi:hypothetical protein